MEVQIPNPEIVQKIFKDKTTDRKNLIISTPKNLLNASNNQNENQNIEIPASKNSSSKDVGKKRRQALWFGNNNLLSKEEEEKEQPQSNIQEEVKQEIPRKRKRDKVFELYNSIIDFIESQTGCIIMLIIILITLCYYDLKIICIPAKYRNIYRTVYGLLILYSCIDFIFRTIIIDRLFNSFYFWIDIICLLIMIFDIDGFSYSILFKILYGKKKIEIYVI